MHFASDLGSASLPLIKSESSRPRLLTFARSRTRCSSLRASILMLRIGAYTEWSATWLPIRFVRRKTVRRKPEQPRGEPAGMCVCNVCCGQARSFQAEALFKFWDLVRGKSYCDAARDAGPAIDQSLGGQRFDHIVNGWRRNSKVALEVCFRRGPAVEFGVGLNEGEVLPLLMRIWRGFSGRTRLVFRKPPLNLRLEFVVGRDALRRFEALQQSIR